MGKYDTLTLPKLPADHREGGAPYQERIELKKAEIGVRSSSELASMYRATRFGAFRDPAQLATSIAATVLAQIHGGVDDLTAMRVTQAVASCVEELGKEELEALVSRKNLELEALAQLIVDAYEAEDLQMQKLGDGSSVSTQVEPYVVVKDKGALRQWLKDTGHGELLETLVPAWQTLNSMMKDLLLEGSEAPAGTEAYLRHKIVFRKARG